MKVFLSGGTGVIGWPLLRRLLEDGHVVTALTRSPERAEWLERAGAESRVCDALDAERLAETLIEARPDVVVNQLTAIPHRINPRRVAAQLAVTNRLRTETTEALARAAASAGAARFITQSVAFAYEPDGPSLATEEDRLFLSAPKSYRAVVEAVALGERAALEIPGVEGVALRYGFFYGPGTAYAADGSFAADVRRRRVPIVGDGGGVFSFIHVEDAAAATAIAVERGEPGTYNIVDDEPAAARDWVPEYARLLGAKPPMRVPAAVGWLAAGPYGLLLMTRLKGASNRKAREALQWNPTHSSWRSGFAAELAGG